MEGKSLGHSPPRFTIDLSRKPEERYVEVAAAFANEIKTLPSLFDGIVKEAHLPVYFTRQLAKLCLRRVHDAEEQAELKGISRLTGINMYLLVAFNVLLDLFMGCTSGGVKVHDHAPQQASLTKDGETSGSRMLHFRTLDWGMDPLRKVIVQLDYVREENGPIIASNITYAGYIGILTAVRPGLSVSLNFRPCHDKSTKMANFRFYLHHAMVLLGARPSIASVLRKMILPSEAISSSRVTRNSDRSNAGKSTNANSSAVSLSNKDSSSWTLTQIEHALPSIVSTAAYLVLSDGERTLVFEKDRIVAKVFDSTDFVVVTNHDSSTEAEISDHNLKKNAKSGGVAMKTPAAEKSKAVKISGMELLVEESVDRKKAITQAYESSCKAFDGKMEPQNMVSQAEIVSWLTKLPVENEETHFSTIMDPRNGSVLFVRRFLTRPGGVK